MQFNRLGKKDKEEDKEANRLNGTFAVLVPRGRHNKPEVVAVKREEISRWETTRLTRPDVVQERIKIMWVINEKQAHDGMKVTMKARLCLRGDMETVVPRSDIPTMQK